MKRFWLGAVGLIFFGCIPMDDTLDGGTTGGDYTVALVTARIGSDPAGINYQKASVPITPLAAPAVAVKLVVDLQSTYFPFENWQVDPPPSGQNWPADCDAFDRNFEMLISSGSGPRIELVRAITPFGGPMHIESDVTDVWNSLTAGHSFEIDIPTYSDSTGQVTGSNGGWTVSAHVVVSPGTPVRKVLAVLPILDTSATSAAMSASVPFTLPAGTTSTRVEYRATGHGQAAQDGNCIGPADEFCQRTHVIAVDATTLDTFTPLREDCNLLCTAAQYVPSGTGGPRQAFSYCAENPCGAPQSVVAPRANWCPGSVTPPNVWTPASAAGAHTFGYAIDHIGGNWRLTAVVIAYGT